MLVHLSGPNAIGKTTAVSRWFNRYGRLGLVAVSCDICRVLVDGQEQREQGWTGSTATVDNKRRLLAAHRATGRVTVVESARTTNLALADSNEPMILVVCDWKLYEHHMRTRCATKGKRYRDDYWTEYKLQYESSRRYINFAQKHLDPKQYKVFEIGDQARDWPAVDEYFYSLFRRLHNTGNQ